MLIYKGFIGQIDYDAASNKLVGEVVNSVDLLEFSGTSAAEIHDDFHQVIDEYLVMQQQMAGVKPVPFVGNFTVCLSTEKQNKVIKAARKNGQSVSHWLNEKIDSHLNEYFASSA
ncbi:hypothetical protein FLL45_05750 [Aliikangiella marina]|uniref:Type II toxin-antitoxin system HicB family antitoxin n=1 Tax=Aliikangiella marina TaxID=1712262 RepID=A0A545TJR3_9GAMM|nr:hypothetical protein [Aliikangiella marina]TQV77447.1 hypothetical protein FLL45_05750 [Aliikangiella marina]